MQPTLFTPFSLRGVSFPNRIAVSPMAQYKGDEGASTAWHQQHWGSLAVSGPAIVIIESTSVERPGYGSPTCLALHTDRQEQAMAGNLAALRSYSDTLMGIQFGHSGRKASGTDPSQGRGPFLQKDGGWEIFAPSAVAFSESWPCPTELDHEGLERVRGAYRQAAQRAARLDLSLIELHGAHGYLLHSFLSPLSNRRNDEYGGSVAKRARFVAEAIAEVRSNFPADRVVGIRLNAHDFQPGGMTIEDTIETVGLLKDAGCDYVCISAGAITGSTRIKPAPGYLVPYAARVKRETGITTFVTGMIVTATQAEEAIADGHADAVEIARAFLDDPRWVWHAAEQLGFDFPLPMQFWQVRPKSWPGSKLLRGSALAAE